MVYFSVETLMCLNECINTRLSHDSAHCTTVFRHSPMSHVEWSGLPSCFKGLRLCTENTHTHTRALFDDSLYNKLKPFTAWLSKLLGVGEISLHIDFPQSESVFAWSLGFSSINYGQISPLPLQYIVKVRGSFGQAARTDAWMKCLSHYVKTISNHRSSQVFCEHPAAVNFFFPCGPHAVYA